MSKGQQALVECWSDRSNPAADLQFFIDGNRVSVVFGVGNILMVCIPGS